MTTGPFLAVVGVVGIGLLAGDAVLARMGLPTISALSRIHPLLRWSIAVAIALFEVWWLFHSSPRQT